MADSASGATGADGGAQDRPRAGPPADAATTFEDLPGDLFGEDGYDAALEPAAPAHAVPSPSPSIDATPGPAAPPTPTTAGGDRADEDPLAMVERLFPGRMVALEPVEDEVEANDDDTGSGAAPPVGDDASEA